MRDQRRPVHGARGGACALAALVLLEQVERATASIDDDFAEVGLRGGDDRRTRGRVARSQRRAEAGEREGRCDSQADDADLHVHSSRLVVCVLEYGGEAPLGFLKRRLLTIFLSSRSMANAIPVPSPQLAGEGFLLRPLGAGDGEAMS